MKGHVFYFSGRAWQDLINYVSGLFPEEACGFLTGSEGIVESIISITNVLHQQTRFKMEPQEQIKAMIEMEQKRLRCLGIFHSHSEGEAYPSESDIKEYAYPEIPAFICAPVGNDWTVRAFWIIEDLVREATIEVLQ